MTLCRISGEGGAIRAGYMDKEASVCPAFSFVQTTNRMARNSHRRKGDLYGTE